MRPELPPLGHCLKVVSKADTGLYSLLKIEDKLLNVHETMPDVEVNEIIDELIDIRKQVF